MQKVVFGLLAAASLVLGACASTGSTHNGSKTAVPGQDTDVDKIATVNRWALDHHATVIWINYPQRPKSG
jgi:outer membrane biogenesis lipoprotein LolB